MEEGTKYSQVIPRKWINFDNRTFLHPVSGVVRQQSRGNVAPKENWDIVPYTACMLESTNFDGMLQYLDLPTDVDGNVGSSPEGM